MTVGDLVEIEWLDAKDHDDKKVEDYQKMKPKDLLARTWTRGKVVMEDKEAIVVCTTEYEGMDSEVTAIPWPWIVGNPKVLK
ncbi:MAG: hypothetical protein GY861_17475 [bacterium]|nr:hypothetical protein [bacterium]